MGEASWRFEDIDIHKPSVARIYDYFLGGFHYFQSDIDAARKLIAANPQLPAMVQDYRGFLHRSVRLCLQAGITQFLDIGSGIASRGSTHDIAHRVNPAARVIYADNDPIVYVHTKAALDDNDNVGTLHADVRYPDKIFHAPETARLLDFDEPLGLVMTSVLHFVPDSDDPAGIVARYANQLAPGSHLVLTHASANAEQRERAALDAARQLVSNFVPRCHAEVVELFAKFELVEPGVTWLENWRPERICEPGSDRPTRFGYAGVGRKL